MSGKLLGAGALVSCVLLASLAQAQVRSSGGSTSSGLFGSRTVGQSGSLQPAQNSLFGGTGAVSNSNTRSSGIGSSATTQELQSGTVTGGERFINANRNAAQSFVGVDASEIRGVGQVGGTALGTGQQGMRGLQNQFNQNQFRQFDQLRQQLQNFNNFNQQGARTQVRIALTLGFEPMASAAATPVAAIAQQRLPRLPGVNLVGAPQVLMEGRTAVVRGLVASERDRELVSRLLLLEPGVSAVRNEMTVAGSTGPGSTPIPPSDPPPAPPS
jgi:hypothetical protein